MSIRSRLIHQCIWTANSAYVTRILSVDIVQQLQNVYTLNWLFGTIQTIILCFAFRRWSRLHNNVPLPAQTNLHTWILTPSTKAIVRKCLLEHHNMRVQYIYVNRYKEGLTIYCFLVFVVRYVRWSTFLIVGNYIVS